MKLKKNNIKYLPIEIWVIIKEYLINYKIYHKIKFKPIIKVFDNMFGPKFTKWNICPQFNNDYELIRSFNFPKKKYNLDLTLICVNLSRNGGWWCGYGWGKKK
tara:strand:- start:82 stop:390 length:309 start_codon:yes stop_codon:yes gene_type:complete